MTAYSLTGGGLTDLGTVIREESDKDSGLFFTPMPTSDSTDAIQLDIFGVTRTIQIQGIYVVGSTNTAYTTIEQVTTALDALANGNQPSGGYSFTSGFSGLSGIKVMVGKVHWEGEPGAPNKLTYTLTLQEGHL